MSDLQIAIAEHPFAVESRGITVERGLTIDEIIARAGIDPSLWGYLHCSVAGYSVPAAMWAHVRPKEAVTIRAIPQGGDKDPLRVALIIGVTMFSGGIATGAIGGFTGVTAAALGAATQMVGRLIVNEIAPPPKPNSNRDVGGGEPTFSLDGARNRVNPWGVVPKIYGVHRMVPPYAAKPFTEIDGGDQYLNLLFCWGYGPIRVDTLKIGTTDLDSFEDVDVSHDYGDGNGFRNKINGNAPFPNTVDEETLSITLNKSDGFSQRTTSGAADEIGVDIIFPRGLTQLKDNGKQTSVTVDVIVEIAESGTNNWKATEQSINSQTVSLDSISSFQNPRGGVTRQMLRKDIIVIDKIDGTAKDITGTEDEDPLGQAPANPSQPKTPGWGYLAAVVSIDSTNGVTDVDTSDADSRLSGFGVSINDGTASSPAVDVASGTLPAFTFNVTEKTTGPVRRSGRFVTPDGSKSYDVRVKRTTDDTDDQQIVDEVAWGKLRTINRDSPVNMSGVALTALRIRATDQLNGIVDQFNGVVQSILPEWGGSSFQSGKFSNSAASAFRDVLSGDANDEAVATSRIDNTKLGSWADFAEDKNFFFNYVFDRETTVSDALDLITASARASKTIEDGKWSVVVDEEQSTPKALITPRNVDDMRIERSYGQQPHAIRARFVNEDKDWQTDEIIVYNDDYSEDGTNCDFGTGTCKTATIFEKMDFPGQTTEESVARAARYYMATDKLRPETVSWTMDIEYLAFKRGDKILYADDTKLISTGYGRVKSITTDGNGDVTDFTLDGEVPLTGGTDIVARVRKSDGTILLLDLTDPVSDETTDSFTLSSATSPGNAPAVGELLVIGESSKETIELLVKSIKIDSQMRARVTARNYDSAVYNAFTESIPDFDPRITEPQDFTLDRPPEPEIGNIRSDEFALFRGDDGTLIERIFVNFSIPAGEENLDPNAVVQARYRKVGSGNDYLQRTAKISSGVVKLDEVEELESYEIDLRTINPIGVASAWVTATASHEVVGKTTNPPNVQGFNAQQNGLEAVVFKWRPSNVKDVKGVRLKFGPQGKATWSANSQDVTELITGTAVTESTLPPGEFTVLAKFIDVTGRESDEAATADVSVINRYDLIDQVDHAAIGWTGVKDGYSKSGDDLVPDVDDEGTYTANSVTLDFEDTVRLWAKVSAFASNIEGVEDYGAVTGPIEGIEDYGNLIIQTTPSTFNDWGSITVADDTQNDWGAITAAATTNLDWGDATEPDPTESTEDYGSLGFSVDASSPLITTQIASRREGEGWSDPSADALDWGEIINDPIQTQNDWGLITESVDIRVNWDTLMRFEDWTIGNRKGIEFKHRLLTREDEDSVIPLIEDYITTIDLLERTEKHEDFAIAGSGATTLTYNSQFHAKPIVTHTSDQESIVFRQNKTTTSVDLKMFDTNGNQVAGNADISIYGA